MSDALVQRALAIGRQRAEQALDSRRRALARRSAALAARHARGLLDAPQAVLATDALAALRAPLGDRSAGLVLAEGDSWFDYPLYDVLDRLEDEHGFEVESLARAGDRIESMAYADGQFDRLSRRLEKLLRNGRVPRAVMLSGGGNDVAGTEFGMLLDHAASPLPGLNEPVVAGVVDRRVRGAFVSVLAGITRVCEEWLGRPLPILVHGYGHAVPDGRGVFGGWGPLPGPWLEPGLRDKGFESLAAGKAVVQALIDRLNAMLQGLAALPEFGHVSYLDLRDLLPSDDGYERWWGNELHPSAEGFDRVAARFAERLNALP